MSGRCWQPRRSRRARTRADRGRARRRRRRRSSGAPRRPRCGTATSASSTSARSRPTSARGCRTSCSARTRCKLTGLVGVRRPPLLRAARAAAVPLDRWAACSPTSSTGAGCSSARSSRSWCCRSCSPCVALVDDPSHVADRRSSCSRSASPTRSARPASNAILPTLVPREDLPGAVALASVQMNLSRVIGPAIGALIYATFDAAPVFAINALTYLFAVDRACCGRRTRAASNARVDERGLRRGCSRASASPAATRCSRTSCHAVLVLVLLARVRRAHAGDRRRRASTSDRRARSTACCTRASGSARRSVRSASAPCSRSVSKAKLLRPGVPRVRGRARGVRAAAASPRSRTRSRCCSATSYFVAHHVAVDGAPVAPRRRRTRGRVMALWIMGFGGTVPSACSSAGWVGHATSITAVMLAGAVWAVVLAAWSNAQIVASEGSTRCLNRHADGLPRAARARRRELVRATDADAMDAVAPGDARVAGARRARAPRRRPRRRRRTAGSTASRPTRGRRPRSTRVADRVDRRAARGVGRVRPAVRGAARRRARARSPARRCSTR